MQCMFSFQTKAQVVALVVVPSAARSSILAWLSENFLLWVYHPVDMLCPGLFPRTKLQCSGSQHFVWLLVFFMKFWNEQEIIVKDALDMMAFILT